MIKQKTVKVLFTITSIAAILVVNFFHPFMTEAVVGEVAFQENDDSVNVSVVNIDSSVLTVKEKLYGKVIIEKQSTLVSPYNSDSATTYVDVGTEVKKGELLVRLDNTVIGRSLKNEKTKASSFALRLKNITNQLVLLEDRQSLYVKQNKIEPNLLTKERLINGSIEINSTITEKLSVEQSLSTSNKNIQDYKESLDNSSFYAKGDGIVTAVDLVSGDEYIAGQSILSIAYKKDFYAEFYTYPYNAETYKGESFSLEESSLEYVKVVPNLNNLGMMVYRAKLPVSEKIYINGSPIVIAQHLILKEPALKVKKSDVITLSKIFLLGNDSTIKELNVTILDSITQKGIEYLIVNPEVKTQSYAVIRNTRTGLREGMKVIEQEEG